MVSILGLERETSSRSWRQGEVLQVANLLCPGNIVVSGRQSACERRLALADGRPAQ